MKIVVAGMLLLFLASGCKHQESITGQVDNPLLIKGKKPVTVSEWKQVVITVQEYMTQAEIGLDTAQAARWVSLFSWVAGIGCLVTILLIALFFVPQTAAFARSLSWLLRPIAEIIAGVSGFAFILIWFVPYRHQIQWLAAGAAVAYLLFRVFSNGFGKAAVTKVAAAVSATLDAAKKNLYKSGDTTANLVKAGASLELAETIREVGTGLTKE